MDELVIKKSKLEEKGWVVKPLLKPSVRHLAEVKGMADYLKTINVIKHAPPKPEGMSKEDFIFSLQANSTKEIITLQKDPDYVRDWSSPMPDGWLAVKDAKNLDEMTGRRELDLDQVNLVETIRRRSKNTFGGSDRSGVSEESRKRAIHHFEVHPPANLTEDQKKQITDLKPPVKGIVASTVEVWKPLTKWQAIKHWIKGGKIRRDKK